jgi:hypothetical protein
MLKGGFTPRRKGAKIAKEAFLLCGLGASLRETTSVLTRRALIESNFLSEKTTIFNG